MKCPFCSNEFDEKDAVKGCKGCYTLGACNMVKCPRCGYEIPPEPKWVSRLRKIFRKGTKK